MTDLYSQLDQVFSKRRQQAFEQWARTAPHQEVMDYLAHANDTADQQLTRMKAGPSYGEGETMPSTPAQDRSRDAFFMERNARTAAGEPDRTDQLRGALRWKEQGYYTPDDNPSVPAPTIGGDLSPRPENTFQNDVMGGTPIAYRSPMDEQAQMQAYVRQQLMQRQQPNLALPQQAVGNPQAFMQSPIGVTGAPAPAQPYQVPGLETQGELSGQQLGAGLKPMMKYPPNLQLMYRSQVPF